MLCSLAVQFRKREDGLTHCPRSLGLLVALWVTACGGQITESGGSGRPISDAGTGPDGEPSTTLPPVLPPTTPATGSALASLVAGCSVEERVVQEPLTEAEARALLVRTWILCDSPPSFFASSDDVGLEVNEDGNWFKLYVDSNGSLTRRSGGMDSGTWEMLDTSDMNGPGHYQVNFGTPSGTYVSLPGFAISPVKMLLSNMGEFTSTYVAAFDETPPWAPDLVPFAPDLSSCALPPPTTNTAQSTDEMFSQIIGKWASCGGSLFPDGGGDVGLEITSLSGWHRLYPSTSPGTAVRGHGFDRAGVAQLVDTTMMNGPGWYQLDLESPGTGTSMLHPKVDRGIMAFADLTATFVLTQ